MLKSVLQRLDVDSNFHTVPSWRQLEYAVTILGTETRSRLTSGLSSLTIHALPTDRTQGTIVDVSTKYGFIAHPQFPNNIFFPAGWTRPPLPIDGLTRGTLVEFTPSKNYKGQDQAMDVAKVESNS